MQKRLSKINNNSILIIHFEDFVKNNEKNISAVCDHLSLNKDISSNYMPSHSKKNIGKYRSILTLKEIELIRKDLSDTF